MRFQPAHQSMINRRFDDRAPCLAWMSPKQALAGKPRIHSPASGIGGHESGTMTAGSGFTLRKSGVAFSDWIFRDTNAGLSAGRHIVTVHQQPTDPLRTTGVRTNAAA